MAEKSYLSPTHNEVVKFMDGYCLVNIASTAYYRHVPFEKRYPWLGFDYCGLTHGKNFYAMVLPYAY